MKRITNYYDIPPLHFSESKFRKTLETRLLGTAIFAHFLVLGFRMFNLVSNSMKKGNLVNLLS
jgi:hypothetical protein